LYQARVLAHGVARTSLRGVPTSVIQKEEKNKDCAEKLSGTTKAARLVHLPKCPNMLAVSTYNTKPVHLLLLSMAVETVEWIVKEKRFGVTPTTTKVSSGSSTSISSKITICT